MTKKIILTLTFLALLGCNSFISSNESIKAPVVNSARLTWSSLITYMSSKNTSSSSAPDSLHWTYSSSSYAVPIIK